MCLMVSLILQKKKQKTCSNKKADHSEFLFCFPVIRASVPKLLLDDVFEQKNDIAKAVEEELEKV